MLQVLLSLKSNFLTSLTLPKFSTWFCECLPDKFLLLVSWTNNINFIVVLNEIVVKKLEILFYLCLLEYQKNRIHLIGRKLV